MLCCWTAVPIFVWACTPRRLRFNPIVGRHRGPDACCTPDSLRMVSCLREPYYRGPFAGSTRPFVVPLVRTVSLSVGSTPDPLWCRLVRASCKRCFPVCICCAVMSPAVCVAFQSRIMSQYYIVRYSREVTLPHQESCAGSEAACCRGAVISESCKVPSRPYVNSIPFRKVSQSSVFRPWEGKMRRPVGSVSSCPLTICRHFAVLSLALPSGLAFVAAFGFEEGRSRIRCAPVLSLLSCFVPRNGMGRFLAGITRGLSNLDGILFLAVNTRCLGPVDLLQKSAAPEGWSLHD